MSKFTDDAFAMQQKIALEWLTESDNEDTRTLRGFIRQWIGELKAENARLRAIEMRLRDDALFKRVATDCHDPLHDERWCSTCNSRGDGMDAYQQALLAEAASAEEPT